MNMPSELILLAKDPLMGPAMVKLIEDVKALECAARKFCVEYRKEFISAGAEIEKWPGWVDGFDPREPVDAAFLALEATLKTECTSESNGSGNG